jgi:hypothetical protein
MNEIFNIYKNSFMKIKNGIIAPPEEVVVTPDESPF